MLRNIEFLVLGCTHYPLIMTEIRKFYLDQVTVLDSSEVVAQALLSYLTQKGLLSEGRRTPDHFLVSDYTESFEASTKLFFKEAVHLEKHPLWD